MPARNAWGRHCAAQWEISPSPQFRAELRVWQIQWLESQIIKREVAITLGKSNFRTLVRVAQPVLLG
jgi:hypothetical protein